MRTQPMTTQRTPRSSDTATVRANRAAGARYATDDAKWAAVVARDKQAQLAAILERERSRGGAAPDAERATDALLGPLYYRAIFTDRPADPDWARGLVEALLR